MQIEKLKKNWEEELILGECATDDQIDEFELKKNIIIPKDLKLYFKIINGTNEKYDERFFQFYSLANFKSIDEDLKDWNGNPDYSQIVNILEKHESYFVFADYEFHMFSFAIQLNNTHTDKNKILSICGAQYKIIANSFSEFATLFLEAPVGDLLKV